MFIRTRTILVIFLTTFVIISFSVLVGIITVRNGIETSQESDLILISEIADRFISSEIRILKLKAAEAAQLLAASEDTQWSDVLMNLESLYPEFIGMAVWDEGRNLIASTGKLPAPLKVMDDSYIQQAFQGKEVISSTVPTTDIPVFYLAAPLPGIKDKILTLSLPRMFFSELISTFLIWDTGHIFMDDADGRLIANPRSEWVNNRVDFINIAEIDPLYEKMINNSRQGLDNEVTVVRYSIYGIPRICVYRSIGGSEEGWFLGVIAPLTESPFRYIHNGLIVVGTVSLFLGLIAAIIASGFIKKPFEEIAALKEAAEANSRFKSDFLANMSHEIRTPMNTILGVAEILMRDNTAPQNITEGLSRIYKSGDLLLNIINDILDLSKIEAGKLELFPSNYEVASLINDTVSLNMLRLGGKEIEFRISVDENMPKTLFGDEVRIKQILNNLLSNAFKYTEKGEVVLSFAVQTGEEENNFSLIFSVSDTGQGMTAEQINALFDQYSRFNYEANRTIEGTGLGMSITRNLVNLMKGEIVVESELRKGSMFTVRLPQTRIGADVLGGDLAEKLQNFRTNEMSHIRKSNIILEPMPYGKVLIVDDVESNLFVAKGLMLPYKLSIDTVTSGFDVIDRIKKGNVYNIVFMDHMMPKMDGVQATKIIRDLGYTHPIVALTANAVKGQQEMFLANGFDDFISKPIDIRQLNTVLKKFIRDKQPLEVLEAARRRTQDSEKPVHEKPQPFVTAQLAEFFVIDALRTVATLEIIQGKGGTINEDDIHLFTTSVHAMKSALANVGEPELSAFAGKLEQAGRNKETVAMSVETPVFLSKLGKVIEKHRSQKDEDEAGKTVVDDYEYLRGELLAIKKACGIYDRKTIKDAITELKQKKWRPPVNEMLNTMFEYLISGDFDDISNTADRIMKTI